MVFSLTKSLLLLLLASLHKKFCKDHQGSIIVGSNYGAESDATALAIVEQLKNDAREFSKVENDPVQDGVTKLKRGSFAACREFLQAEAVFYTHSLSDVIVGGHKLSFLKRLIDFPTCIFTQHGVIGLKDTKQFREYVRSLEPTFDLMCVSSKWEKNIVHELGVPANKLRITGLARYDDLDYCQHRNVADIPRVMVAFTWQEFNQYETKCNEVEIQLRRLQDEGVALEYSFETHPMIRRETGEQSTIDPDTLTKRIGNSDLLITDDSSIAWDMLYSGGEVFFYRASTDWFIKPDYLMERRADSQNELYELILSLVQTKQRKAVPVFTEYQDEKNASRVLKLAK